LIFSVPLAARKAAKCDEADERNDDPDPEAPDNRHDDSKDHEETPESDTSEATICLSCHEVLLSLFRFASVPDVAERTHAVAADARAMERARVLRSHGRQSS
jgi:hypothetical protein